METTTNQIDSSDVTFEPGPHRPARPMKVVTDDDGSAWLCDAGVDEHKDLAAQGCWRCGERAFTRDD